MREILFRGKRSDNGEWLVGHLLRYFGGRARIVETGENIFCYEMDTSIIQTVAHHVIPSTVGQYTGLTDKNGKKILRGILFGQIMGIYQKWFLARRILPLLRMPQTVFILNP